MVFSFVGCCHHGVLVVSEADLLATILPAVERLGQRARICIVHMYRVIVAGCDLTGQKEAEGSCEDLANRRKGIYCFYQCSELESRPLIEVRGKAWHGPAALLSQGSETQVLLAAPTHTKLNARESQRASAATLTRLRVPQNGRMNFRISLLTQSARKV